jgi:hypothetical protein
MTNISSHTPTIGIPEFHFLFDTFDDSQNQIGAATFTVQKNGVDFLHLKDVPIYKYKDAGVSFELPTTAKVLVTKSKCTLVDSLTHDEYLGVYYALVDAYNQIIEASLHGCRMPHDIAFK